MFVRLFVECPQIWIWCTIKYVNSNVLWTLKHLKFLNTDKLLHPFSSIWVCNIDTMKMHYMYMNAVYLHDLLTSLVWMVMGRMIVIVVLSPLGVQVITPWICIDNYIFITQAYTILQAVIYGCLSCSLTRWAWPYRRIYPNGSWGCPIKY